MHRILLLAALAVILAGCVGPAQNSAPPTSMVVPTLAVSPANLAVPVPAAPENTASPEAASIQSENGGLQVTLFTLAEVETAVQPFLLKGAAPQGTVLTVNEQILVVDVSAAFSVEIPLEEGPNLVEVIASNAAGDEVDFLLTILYNP